MQHFDFHIPTRVIFGAGRIRELGASLPPAAQRVMLVTDRGVADNSDALDIVTTQLENRQVTVFDEVEPNPSFATVDAAGASCRNHEVDLVVGLGGGSPMDAAKGIAILATNNERLADIVDRGEPARPPLPVVCIPTTSGTGSEVTPFAVFSDRDREAKRGYVSDSIFPMISIVDPELTYSMPHVVAVDTGLDALTHAFEAYISLDASPMSDLYALRAMEIVRDDLASAVTKDLEAMEQMALAAMLAGVAISHAGTTLLHVMGYPLTVFHGISHGRANAALLPRYVSFLNRRSTVQEKVARAEALFGSTGGIRAFVEDRGVSTFLADYGIDFNEIPAFVEKVIGKDDLRITPAEIGREDIAAIFWETPGA